MPGGYDRVVERSDGEGYIEEEEGEVGGGAGVVSGPLFSIYRTDMGEAS